MRICIYIYTSIHTYTDVSVYKHLNIYMLHIHSYILTYTYE